MKPLLLLLTLFGAAASNLVFENECSSDADCWRMRATCFQVRGTGYPGRCACRGDHNQTVDLASYRCEDNFTAWTSITMPTIEPTEYDQWNVSQFRIPIPSLPTNWSCDLQNDFCWTIDPGGVLMVTRGQAALLQQKGKVRLDLVDWMCLAGTPFLQPMDLVVYPPGAMRLPLSQHCNVTSNEAVCTVSTVRQTWHDPPCLAGEVLYHRWSDPSSPNEVCACAFGNEPLAGGMGCAPVPMNTQTFGALFASRPWVAATAWFTTALSSVWSHTATTELYTLPYLVPTECQQLPDPDLFRCLTGSAGYQWDPEGIDHCQGCTAICGTHSVCNTSTVCTCATNWTGSWCEQSNECRFKKCSGHGKCTHLDTCLCDVGFEADNCSALVPPFNASACSEQRCSGNGACQDAQLCACDPYHAGYACADVSCVNGGNWNGTSCEPCFNRSFSGRFCETFAESDACQPHGTFDAGRGVCACAYPYTALLDSVQCTLSCEYGTFADESCLCLGSFVTGARCEMVAECVRQPTPKDVLFAAAAVAIATIGWLLVFFSKRV